MNVDRLLLCFQLLILGWETATSVLKIKNTDIVGNDNPSVLQHSMKIVVNFMRRLTNSNVLYLAYLKHEHCSQQYSTRRVFIPINCYMQKEDFQNCFQFTISTSMLQTLPCDLLIFKYPTFQFKILLRYKPYKFPTEIFVGMFFFIQFYVSLWMSVYWISIFMLSLEKY